jgi:S-adenosylmethionine:diacylglycerol 3-amino-3-carboxypropyl transferase
MHSLQIPLSVEARGDIPLPSSFTHFLDREVPKQIQFCHTQLERATWFAKRSPGARRISVFDPGIRRFIVMWIPTVGSALVRLDGPDSGHPSRADALDEAQRFREQAAAFAKGERHIVRRNRP